MRVNIKRLLPLDTISFFPCHWKRAHLFQKKKKKSFFLQGGQRCGAVRRGWGCRRRRGMKECFKERPHTGHCREKTGGGGEKKCLSGKGGGAAGPSATGWRKPGRPPPGCEPECRERAPVTLGHRRGGKGAPRMEVCREEGGQRQGLLQVRPRERDGQTEGSEASPGPKGVARHPIDRRETLGQRAATLLSPARPRGPRAAAAPRPPPRSALTSTPAPSAAGG